MQKTAIPIHGDEHTIGFLRSIYRHIFDKDRNINDSFVATLIANTFTESFLNVGGTLDLFGMRITPFRMLHGGLPILSYRFEPGEALHRDGAADVFPLAYCTDVSGVPTASWRHLEGLGTLVIDALRHRKHPTHFTLEQAMGVAERVRPRMTYFTHMAHELGFVETQATMPEGMSLAWDGLELTAEPR